MPTLGCYIQFAFVPVSRYLIQRAKRISEWSEEFFKGFTKNIYMKRLSFIIQFKIEFLLPITGCRKLLGKMPAWEAPTYEVT